MILISPYESGLQKLNKMNDVVKGINTYITISHSYIRSQELDKGIRVNPFINNETKLEPIALYGISDIEHDVSSFSHSIVNFKNNWIAMDFRPYVKPDLQAGNFTIKNQSEFNLTMNRFVLSGMYAVGNLETLYGLKFPHFVFSNWISENLTRKFGLGPGDQLRLKVLALIYYNTMFEDGLTDDDLEKLVIRTKTEVLIPDMLKEIFEMSRGMNSLADFCEMCYKVTDNVRLNGLDPNVMVNVFSTSWNGALGKELAILALEHPPTWISLVHSSLTDRSFKRSVIATTVGNDDKRGKGAEFLSIITPIINGHVGNNAYQM